MNVGAIHPGPVDLATGASLPEITEVQRITLKPGDRLAIRVAAPLTPQQADMLKKRVTALWPGVPVLVLDDSMSIEVVEAP